MIRIFNAYTGIDQNGGVLSTNDTDDNGFVNTAQVINDPIENRTRTVLNKRKFNIEIIDSSLGSNDANVIYTVVGCRIASQNIVVDRASLMGVQVMMDAEYLVRHQSEVQ
jgi:hypothetical protein